jgi:hypothetical protein
MTVFSIFSIFFSFTSSFFFFFFAFLFLFYFIVYWINQFAYGMYGYWWSMGVPLGEPMGLLVSYVVGCTHPLQAHRCVFVLMCAVLFACSLQVLVFAFDYVTSTFIFQPIYSLFFLLFLFRMRSPIPTVRFHLLLCHLYLSTYSLFFPLFQHIITNSINWIQNFRWGF